MNIRSMLSTLSCVAVALSVAVLSFAQDDLEEPAATIVSAAQPASDVGRFQLFDGQYAVTSLKGPEVAERHLFRMDTVTGMVWVGKQVQYVDRKSGKVVQQRYWEPFEQYLEGQQVTVPAGR